MITTGISRKVDDSCSNMKETKSILAIRNPFHLLESTRISFLSLSNWLVGRLNNSGYPMNPKSLTQPSLIQKFLNLTIPVLSIRGLQVTSSILRNNLSACKGKIPHTWKLRALGTPLVFYPYSRRTHALQIYLNQPFSPQPNRNFKLQTKLKKIKTQHQP